MRADRLELVAKKLDTVGTLQFDFGQWVDKSWGGAQDLSCGAPACALGHAATIPELQEAGLRICRAEPFRSNAAQRRSAPVYIGLAGEPLAWDTRTVARESLRSACVIFEINGDEADYLFIPLEWEYIAAQRPGPDDVNYKPSPDATAQEVAAHIRAFILRGGVPEGYDR